MAYGNCGLDGVHYRLFERLCDAWSVSGAPENPATRALVSTIRRLLVEPFAGAGCILVVEVIAWDIVSAYRELLVASEEQLRVAGRADLSYVDLHLASEPGHAERAKSLVRMLSVFDGAAQRIEVSVGETAMRFGAFWEALAQEVFA